MQSTCFIVIGTPRSGTSLTAGLLHALGVPMAGAIPTGLTEFGLNAVGPNEWNAKGNYEDVEFANLFNAASLGGRPFPIEQFSELLRARSSLPRWGFKHNAAVFYLREILATLYEAGIDHVLLRTRRASRESVQSWAARTGQNLAEATAHIARYADELASWVAFDVSFDALTDRAPETRLAEVQRLADCVGLPVTAAAREFPAPDLRRFRDGI